MVARLRSDKGSFVRSPLGAFETPADDALAAGIVTFAAEPVGGVSTRVLTDPECQVQNAGDGLGGILYTQFQIDSQSGSGPIDWESGVFVGLDSGETFRLSDYNLGFICSRLTEENYENRSVPPVSTFYPHVFGVQTTGSFYERATLSTNIGRFPGEAHPAFILNELFEFRSAP